MASAQAARRTDFPSIQYFGQEPPQARDFSRGACSLGRIAEVVDGARPPDIFDRPIAGGAPRPRRRHLVWLPVVPGRIGDGARLLLALAAEGDLQEHRGHLADLLGVAPRTATRYRDELIAEGAIVRVAGRLVVVAARVAALRREAAAEGTAAGWVAEASAIPRALIARCGMSAARKVAAAEMLGEGHGFRRHRRYVRSDAERGERAGVCRHTLIAAREDLVALGLATLRQRKTGGARYLVGVAPTGRRLSSAELDKNAHTTQDSLRSSLRQTTPPPDGPPAGAGAGPGDLQEPGWADGRQTGRDRAGRSWAATQATERQILAGIAGLRLRHRVPTGPDPRRADVDRLLERERCIRFLRGGGSAVQQTEHVLIAAGVLDLAPRRRRLWAEQLAQRLGPAAPAVLAVVVADVAADARVGRVGAVVAHRLPRLLGADPRAALSPGSSPNLVDHLRDAPPSCATEPSPRPQPVAEEPQAVGSLYAEVVRLAAARRAETASGVSRDGGGR